MLVCGIFSILKLFYIGVKAQLFLENETKTIKVLLNFIKQHDMCERASVLCVYLNRIENKNFFHLEIQLLLLLLNH